MGVCRHPKTSGLEKRNPPQFFGRREESQRRFFNAPTVLASGQTPTQLSGIPTVVPNVSSSPKKSLRYDGSPSAKPRLNECRHVAKVTSISALRSLVAAWTPVPITRSGEGVATSVPAVDEALGGGLPRGRVTELVSTIPSSGGNLVFAGLLASTRAARLRIALIDAADGFAPRSYRPDLLRHLVWVRPRSLPEALACADVLVRDGNFAVVVLDLRGVALRTLRQQPSNVWHRLRLSAEQNSGAVMVQTEVGVVPAVPWRLSLGVPLCLGDLRRTREERMVSLSASVSRGHITAREEMSA